MHLDGLDVARLGVAAGVLAFASYTDWRWRRAPDLLWLVAGVAGLALLLAEAALDPAVPRQWPLLAASGLFAAMVLGLHALGLLAGGADAKALMALALLLPLPLHLGPFPLHPSPLPPAFGVLGDALLAFLAVPLGLLAANAARGHLRWPFALLALRMPIEDARRKHYWPMEYVKDGEVRTMWMPSRFLWEDEDWDALKAAGRTDVWVTPKVPFMLPLLAGLVAAAFYGDALALLLLRGL